MRRWLPGGLAGRVAGLLIVAFLVAHGMHVLILFHDREVAVTRTFALAVADRVVAVVEHMGDRDGAERDAFLAAHESRWLRLELRPTLPELPVPESRHADQIRPVVRRALASLGDRPIDIRLPRPRPMHGERAGPGRRDEVLPVAVAVGLDDGSWLVATGASQARLPNRRNAHHMLGTLAVLALLGWFAARRLTRPLRRFADAADRLGVDMHAPPLPETGSGELRRAIRAFNRMQERLRRLVDDRTRMLAAISHDLRTSLTRLRLRGEYIDDPEQRRKALADLDEMQAMLTSTLAFARDEALDEERTRLDLAALLQSLCDDLADAGQPVAWDGPDRLRFEGRPRALRRAFANLIDNAVRYGDEAEVTLAEGDERVEVRITDRGPGIPETEREKVFAPFYRLEPSRSRETGGAGLGLALARSVARHHGGDVHLDDRPDGGLVVRVDLPLR
ncbi:MAG: ATP-binding protein [Acidobacteriota bacterium]